MTGKRVGFLLQAKTQAYLYTFDPQEKPLKFSYKIYT